MGEESREGLGCAVDVLCGHRSHALSGSWFLPNTNTCLLSTCHVLGSRSGVSQIFVTILSKVERGAPLQKKEAKTKSRNLQSFRSLHWLVADRGLE